MTKIDKAQAELTKLLDLFETCNVPDAVSKVLLPARDVPCAQWSLSNRMLCLLSGTDDARGFRQWQEVGRHVKKGSQCLRILAPRMVKSKDKTDDNGDPKSVLIGFKAVPVFRYEDTDGESLNREAYTPPELPPLFDVAKRFGCNVEYLGHGLDSSYYGRYNIQSHDIRLCTHDESTFFHELAHAAHHRVKGSMTGGQDWKQEIVAELSAAVLCRRHGLEYNGNAFRYIRREAEKAKKDAHKACLAVLADVEKVLAEILHTQAVTA